MPIAHEDAHTIIRDILFKQHVERVWFASRGGSLTGLWSGKYFLDCETKKLVIGYVISSEFVRAMSNALGKNSVVILASQRGNTAEAVETARITHQKGTAAIGLICIPGTSLYECNDYATGHHWMRYSEVVDPMQQKAVYSLWLAPEVLAQTEGYAHYDQMVSVFASFESVIRSARQQVQADARHFAKAWKSEKIIYTMSSDPSFGTAYRESIHILLEVRWVSSTSTHNSEYFHGPFEITETGTPSILLKSSDHTRPLDDYTIHSIERHQGKLQIIDVKKVGIDTPHTNVREYLCDLLHNCVLDVYNLMLATTHDHPLTTRRYVWKARYRFINRLSAPAQFSGAVLRVAS